MIRRRKGARAFTRPCLACGCRLDARWKACPRCGHDEASWSLIEQLRALPGTVDLGYHRGRKSTK